MIFKVIGILMMLFGLFMIVYFPAKLYQKSDMTETGIMIGLVSFSIGILLLVFA